MPNPRTQAEEARGDLPDLADEARNNPYSIGTGAIGSEHVDEIPRALETVAERADSGREVGDELRAMAERIRFVHQERQFVPRSVVASELERFAERVAELEGALEGLVKAIELEIEFDGVPHPDGDELVDARNKARASLLRSVSEGER